METYFTGITIYHYVWNDFINYAATSGIVRFPLDEFFSLKFIWVPIVQVILLLLGFMFKKLELPASGIALLLVPLVMGHATYPRYGGVFTVMVNASHLIAASIWLGGLFALLTMAKRNEFPDLLNKVGSKFSKWALWSLLVIILTGFTMTFLYIPSFSLESFLKSQWGRAITVKVVLTILIVVIGYLQRNAIKKFTNQLVNKFYGRGIFEIVYGLLILLFASILVVSTPSAAEQGVYPLEKSYQHDVKVDINPLKPGLNVLTLELKKQAVKPLNLLLHKNASKILPVNNNFAFYITKILYVTFHKKEVGYLNKMYPIE